MENTETQKILVETIENEFNQLVFTQTDGNSHYASSGAEDLHRRNASIAAFLEQDELIEPDIYPTRHGENDIQEAIEKYESMLDILFAEPERTPEIDRLIDRIINKTGELFRYEELVLAMGSKAVSDQLEHRQKAADLSMEIMGEIDQDSFDMLLDGLSEAAKHSSQPLAKELLELIGARQAPESAKSIELELNTREVIGRDLLVLYPGLKELMLAEPETEAPVSPEEALPIFRSLQEIADLDDEWTVELTNGKAAETSSAKKKVTIGRNRVNFKSYRDAVAVGFHESVVHAGRSEGVSLPGYLDFEEGLATRLQQIISGEERTPGVQYYLSIGLQVGADRGGEPRSYRETFEILWRREALLMEKTGKSVDIDKAKLQAQRQIHRTRRGGAVDTRDSAYFIGAQKAANWLNEVAKLPDSERRIQLAKVLTNRYDPTNTEHAAYMRQRA